MSKLLSILVGTVLAIGAVSMQGKETDRIKMNIPVVYEVVQLETEMETEPEIEITEVETEMETMKTVVETIEETMEEPVEETEIEKIYFDIPLDHDLQDHIFAECEKHNISPAFIIAVIEHESSFRVAVSGDDGKSFGLMQVQEKWHRDRMERLGCTNLKDPYQCVTVGIDYFAELFDYNPDVYWVLMAYNGGMSYANRHWPNGNISDYALEITARVQYFQEMIE